MRNRVSGAVLALVAGATALTAVPASAASEAPARTLRAAVESKAFYWDPLSNGDCHQYDGRIVLRSDGTGTWSATTYTDDTRSGDYWHSDFIVYTAQGTRLFGAGPFSSPEMDDGEGGTPPRYQWGQDFTFDPGLYAGAARINQKYRC